MLYFAYQCQDDLMEPIRAAAAGALDYWGDWARAGGLPGSRRMAAQWEMVSRMRMSHHRPDYGITSVTTGNREATVTEEATYSTPFGTLLRFRKDVDIVQPKVLLVAPLSGHFATLLRATVRTLLADHDVYITDWHNARDVPLSAGRFGFEDYIEHVIRFLEVLGPGANVIAVCQPCVQVLAATAIMAEDDNPATPKTMTLMAGPVDTRINPTKVNELATSKPIRWFEDTLLASVPARHRGGGRRVYPGFVQLMAFMAMNMERHVKQHQALYDHLARGETAEAEAIKTFYDEYFAVLDLPAEFYIETVDFVFQRALLAKGELTFRGRKVNPKAIRRTALLTVEGERDDICALGQTVAAHDLCSSLRPFLKRHHMQVGVGHYGVFSGRKWEGQIYPNVRNMILANA
ncbi:polyhydroxyalkanoate depolymerase [Prosthecomicrobium hirschii]|uniref:polyhydroxyalkanoate depolymerase n=1 Tax=Prosthecodimorpha hirschii TaxID=665126 RepID=UPI0011290900|nr:polyhydroxyalkanoate depolymerase [Prosthecomicrobium hirschii]MCW1841730.1 polyhydroxyalkanoate depolymerase [Prosthecomicrobium hirschii]TPQ51489.1 polyhydroxyalkanoate depolymerase [Prosthecomicrobium hirschii]